MSDRFERLALFIVLPVFCVSLCRAQDHPPQDSSSLPSAPQVKLTNSAPSDAQFAREGVVYEKVATVMHYDANGLGDKTLTVVARVQSEGAVHEAGLLTFAYASGEEKVEPVYVRVRKPDGTVVNTPPDDAQDMPTEVTRAAPFYSDLREFQIPVKSLSPGDKLEYQMRFVRTKAPAAGQFWGALNFVRNNVVLDESVELSFPKDKYVLVLSPKNQPAITEENNLKVYRWKTSQLEPTVGEDKKKEQAYDPEALAPVTGTTFHNWQEGGEGYGSLGKNPG